MKPDEFGLCVDGNDPFLEDVCRWIVTLEDGTIIHQDDNRPEVLVHHSAWVRLGLYMQASGLAIKSWKLQFRKSNIVHLPLGVGHVYSRGALGVMSMGTTNADRTTTHYHIVGTINKKDQEVINRIWYHSPSLVNTKSGDSDLASLDPLMVNWQP